MDYFLKASVIIILFYACYKLFLQRDTFFQANRWFLLIGLFASIVLPLIIIPIYIEYTPTPVQFFETTTTTFPPQQISEAPNFDYWQLLPYIYLAGVLFVLTQVTLQFISLNRLLKHQKKTKKGQFTYIETDTEIAPFSFFNRIVFNSNQFTKTELEHIIAHEKAHATQLHSADILIIQIASILFWFNPCIWLYKKALQQNLEFIADHAAQNKIKCAKSYQTVLLKASLTSNQLAITNNFYQSLIKKRIVMLQKTKSKTRNQLKFAIVLPFLALFLMSFNTKEVYIAKAETMQDATASNLFTITSNSTDQDIEAIKNQLEAQTDGLKVKFSNLKRNLEGKITKLSIETKSKNSNKFNHNATYGNDLKIPVSNIHLKIENGVLVFENQNQEIVMQATDKSVVTDKTITKQDSVSYTENTIINSQTKATKDLASKLLITEEGDKPLYVIDGKITEGKLDIEPENIASISVLKGDMATKKYGSKGKHGVIEITLKNSNDIIIANEGVIITQDKNGNLIKNGVTYTPSNGNSSVINKNDDKSFTMSIATSTLGNQIINENINIISDNKLNDTLQFKAINLKAENNEKPMIFIDNQRANKQQLSNLKHEDIKSMSVLKSKKDITPFGKEGKNGVILITTKSASTNNLKASDKKESSWDVNYGISSTTYNDDETPAKYNIVLHITKNTPDLVLEQHKKQLASLGKELEYITLRRNNKDEITKLKMSLTNNKGQTSKVLYQSNKGIPAINITIDTDGEVNIESQKQD
ncbi:M56 family metallopeptidase [Psychroserpens sp. NJDZ02]|uniref:M56 family metallopeptidase n=1 Tax=Psychroserpens sp. NJDZ02 TaxID=2570561 RepID=UPI0010A837F3|nr:M56 family metallopeptidase [Psychroserpens sp. NJDZ02]QCE42015.1 hypothetical protein E9099_11580 [Psychroserpens sp. NJDZ02]